MSKKITIPNTSAEKIFALMKSLAVSPKTRDQLKNYFGHKKIPYNTINGALKLGFIEEIDGKKLKLCNEYVELIKLRKNNPKLKETFGKVFIQYEPFKTFIKIIEVNHGEFKKDEIGNMLEAELNADWKKSSRNEYINSLINWGQFSGILENKNGLIKLHPKYLPYSPIESGSDMNNTEILNKYLYDKFCENNIDKICNDLNEECNKLGQIKKSGDLFVDIVSRYCNLLGFSTRKTNGIKEKEVELSYDSRNGGGDLGLFIHLPIEYQGKNYNGISIASELKETNGGAPKKAIDQVRTFSEQIKRLYPKYKHFKVVISQSPSYDPHHARDKADPDVIHLPFNVIKYLVEVQKSNFNENKTLISPMDIVNIFDYSIKNGKLELTIDSIKEFLDDV